MGFTREQLESQRGKTVPDLLGPGVRLLFVGINPGLWTAATQTHFCHPSNRFYPALKRAGLIDFDLDTSKGLSARQKQALVDRGIGLTNLVARATARASELSDSELRSGVTRLGALVAETAPRVVAVAGVTAFRTAFARRDARNGPQLSGPGAASLWVVPNPSGLNAHETIESLSEWYMRAAVAAGIA